MSPPAGPQFKIDSLCKKHYTGFISIQNFIFFIQNLRIVRRPALMECPAQGRNFHGRNQAQNRLDQASRELDKLVGVRTRQIRRRLKDVETLDSSTAREILELDESEEYTALPEPEEPDRTSEPGTFVPDGE